MTIIIITKSMTTIIKITKNINLNNTNKLRQREVNFSLTCINVIRETTATR